MGFLDWIKSAVKTVGDKVSSVFSSVKDGLVHVASGAKDFAQKTWGVVKSVGVTAYNDTKAVVQWGGNQIATVTKGTIGILSSPFTMIAIAIGGLLALKFVK